MKYLFCPNCSTYNEIKSEYLTLCAHCGKKLPDDFQSWKKSNQDKTFEEYKQIVGQDKPATVFLKKSGKSAKYWIGFVITFAVFSVIGTFLGHKLNTFIRKEKTSQEILTQKWEKQVLTNVFSIETPSPLTRTEIPLPAQVKSVLAETENYIYSTSKGFKVSVNFFRMKPEVGMVNLQGAANGSVSEMKMQPGVSDFEYSEETLLKDDYPGFMQRGSYSFDGNKIIFINTGFSKGLKLYQVVAFYQDGDEVGKTAAERVIQSIHFEDTDKAL